MKNLQALKTKYLSEMFTKGDFASMSNDKMYAFYSVPDSGKTTMIINILQPYLKESSKKALYLSPRKTINDQNKANFDDTVIHSKTYQKLEHDIINGINFFKDYDFIICDECHYFVEDSAINNLTDESFNFINKSDAIVILMSGTPDYLEGIKDLWERPIVTLADIDKSNHNITKVCLSSATKEDETLLKKELDRLVRMKKRIIVYDSNIKELFDLSNEYKQKASELGIKISFICSSRNRDYFEFSDTENLEILMDTKRIDTDLLFITSALNTGISIDEDFEYLFIFGNPAKTDIFQLIARIRKGNINRHIKTVYCSVPKYNSIKCRLEGLQFDLTYLKNPIEWQTKKKSRGFPDFMQMRHSFMYDDKGNQLFTPEGDPMTESRPDVNQMKLGKLKQDITEYSLLLGYGSMIEAYRQLFTNRYNGITVTTLREELEQHGVLQLISLIEQYADQEYLEDDQQEAIKNLCCAHGLLTSIGKINELLDKHGSKFRLMSRQRKLNGRNLRSWSVIR